MLSTGYCWTNATFHPLPGWLFNHGTSRLIQMLTQDGDFFHVCESLVMPNALDKLEGPSTSLNFSMVTVRPCVPRNLPPTTQNPGNHGWTGLLAWLSQNDEMQTPLPRRHTELCSKSYMVIVPVQTHHTRHESSATSPPHPHEPGSSGGWLHLLENILSDWNSQIHFIDPTTWICTQTVLDVLAAVHTSKASGSTISGSPTSNSLNTSPPNGRSSLPS